MQSHQSHSTLYWPDPPLYTVPAHISIYLFLYVCRSFCLDTSFIVRYTHSLCRYLWNLFLSLFIFFYHPKNLNVNRYKLPMERCQTTHCSGNSDNKDLLSYPDRISMNFCQTVDSRDESSDDVSGSSQELEQLTMNVHPLCVWLLASESLHLIFFFSS